MTPDQDLSARLDPCQFCGGYCSEIADVSVAEYPHPKFQVQCVACGLSGPIAPSENEAAKLWNLVHTNHERAVQAAVAKAVEAERESCAEILDKEAADYEADARRYRGGSDPHHYRRNKADAVRKYAAAIRSRGVAG